MTLVSRNFLFHDFLFFHLYMQYFYFTIFFKFQTGTFLRGQINIGLDVFPAGRMGDAPVIGLAQTLDKMKFKLGRLKTGTPPRIKAQTVNYEILESSSGDEPPVPFSFMNEKVWLERENRPQKNCHITHTNEKVHELILDNMDQNRHVSEEITVRDYFFFVILQNFNTVCTNFLSIIFYFFRGQDIVLP